MNGAAREQRHDAPSPTRFAAFESDRTVIKPTPAAAPRRRQPRHRRARRRWRRRHAGRSRRRRARRADDASLNPLVLGGGAAAERCAAHAARRSQHPNPAGAARRARRRRHASSRRRPAPRACPTSRWSPRATCCARCSTSRPPTRRGAVRRAGPSRACWCSSTTRPGAARRCSSCWPSWRRTCRRNRDLLELIYVALALGFEGRYRVLDNGRAQLDSVRERLAADAARQGRADAEPSCRRTGRRAGAGTARLRDGLPLWVVGALAAPGAARRLSRPAADAQRPLRHRLRDAAGPRVKPPVPIAAAPPPLAPRRRGSRASSSPRSTPGLVRCATRPTAAIVTCAATASSSRAAPIDRRARPPLLARIGEALNAMPGQVLITGHTDNQPIRSMRFPSNWHLSQARADAVKALLAGAGQARRACAPTAGPTPSRSRRTTRRRTARATAASRSRCCSGAA